MEVSSISVTSSPQTTIVDELILEQLFADECALLANTEEALQTVFDHFAKAAPSFGQTISLKKIELLHEDHSHAMHSLPQITINSHLFNLVKQFTYLGSVLSNNATMIKDMTTISPKPTPLVIYIQLLGRFHQRCLQSIMGIHWHDYDTNIKVPERARMPRIKAMLLHRHLRWADHVVVME